jgi:uncharacterized phage protein (TIGR01671 family)
MELPKREIKFRCWIKSLKEMQSVWEVMEAQADDDCVLMQYTGLKDENGKEIYEGDILLGRFVLNDVENFIFLSLTEKEKMEQSKLFIVKDIFYPYTSPLPEDLEVIGNIFENPDLLT